jgi:nitrite reductase (NAD(P)H)
MEECGVKKDAVGCEICKPAIGSILSSLWNEHVMNPVHHQNQDTNDRFMANIQVRIQSWLIERYELIII